MTNDQKLKKLIAANTPTQNALLLERILKIIEMTQPEVEKYPEEYCFFGITPSDWEGLFKNIDTYLQPK